VRDASLRHCLQFGVGLHHAGLSEPDRQLVEALFVEQKIQVGTFTHLWCGCDAFGVVRIAGFVQGKQYHPCLLPCFCQVFRSDCA
jgi:hypothetical protein